VYTIQNNNPVADPDVVVNEDAFTGNSLVIDQYIGILEGMIFSEEADFCAHRYIPANRDATAGPEVTAWADINIIGNRHSLPWICERAGRLNPAVFTNANIIADLKTFAGKTIEIKIIAEIYISAERNISRKENVRFPPDE
jgi:hypothetical protein